MSSLRAYGASSVASPVSKSQHVRPAPSRAWISPTKMPCMRARAASAESGRSGVRRAWVRILLLRTERGSLMRSWMSTRTKRSSRARSSTGWDFLMVPPSWRLRRRAGWPPLRSWFLPERLCRDFGRLWVSVRVADGAGTGDAPGGQQQLLEVGHPVGGPLHLFFGLEQRLDEHLPVAPVVELVLEGEVERADGGGVGDPTRVVAVVGVRRDLVRDQHPVDADQLLD